MTLPHPGPGPLESSVRGADVAFSLPVHPAPELLALLRASTAVCSSGSLVANAVAQLSAAISIHCLWNLCHHLVSALSGSQCPSLSGSSHSILDLQPGTPREPLWRFQMIESPCGPLFISLETELFFQLLHGPHTCAYSMPGHLSRSSCPLSSFMAISCHYGCGQCGPISWCLCM